MIRVTIKVEVNPLAADSTTLELTDQTATGNPRFVAAQVYELIHGLTDHAVPMLEQRYGKKHHEPSTTPRTP